MGIRNNRVLKSALGLGIFVLLLPPLAFGQKFEGLAKTPPMGWNSWNHFACDINEELIKRTADAMVSSGMRDAGYVYINLDDCWHGERDSNGFIQPHPDKFPSGMKALADYVHGLDLKIGLYSDAGTKTCGGKPGSQGYEYQDALQYARWEIDYLKYDWCNTGRGKAQRNPIEAYTTMRDALYAAKRPIVYSICEWGNNKPWEWGKEIGHLWRTTGDITNCWECEINHGNWISGGIMNILDKQHRLRGAAGVDHWNDPDMMEVGNLPTINENRAHFSMWAMLAAPLIAGTDIRKMSKSTREILTNKNVIAVNQDVLGIQGFPYRREENIEYWVKPLENGDWAFTILNRSNTRQKIKFDWAEHPIGDNVNELNVDFSKFTYKLLNLWENNRRIGDTSSPLRVTVSARDVLMLRMKKNTSK